MHEFLDVDSLLNDDRLLKIAERKFPVAYSYSDTQFEIIKKYVIDFQKSLDAEHDIGVMLTNFGSTVLMEVTEIGYEESVLMVFKGYVDGRKATLIQHINQLNFFAYLNTETCKCS